MESSNQIHVGRPYGGVAILWAKRIHNLVKCIDTESNRVVAILFNSESTKLLFINVYMPCDTGICDVLRVEQFNDVLNEIARLIQSVNTNPYNYDVVVGGDFNTDYNWHSAHITLLESLCNDEHLLNAKMHNSAQIDYTYCNYASGVTSTIDHSCLRSSLTS